MFILAIERNFVQGRTTTSVTASCLYIVCRREKSPHMLIDFSDALQVNLFPLGATYVRLCRELNLALPTVDPSLYIHRFAARLDLGESAHAVSMAALRIVSRMRRDWMVSGRRPAGVCGAALLVAARVHGHRRTRGQILRALRIDDSTLQNRLAEFEATPAASLTPQDFERLDAADGALGSVASSSERPSGFEADPPAFVRGRILDDINIRRHLLLEKGTPEALHELEHGDALSSGAISAETLHLIDTARVLSPPELARQALLRGYLQVDTDGKRVFVPAEASAPLLADAPAAPASSSTALVLHGQVANGDKQAIAPLHPSILKSGKGLVNAGTPRVDKAILQSEEYRCMLARISADNQALHTVASIVPQSVARGLIAEALLSESWGSKRGKPMALKRNAQAAVKRLAAHEEQLNRLRTRLLRRRVDRRRRRRRWEQLYTPSTAARMVCPTAGNGISAHGAEGDSDSDVDTPSAGGAAPLPTIMSIAYPDTDSEAEWLYGDNLVLADALKPPSPPQPTGDAAPGAPDSKRAGAAAGLGTVTVSALRASDATMGWADGESDVYEQGYLTDEQLVVMSGGDTEDEAAERALPLCEGGSPLELRGGVADQDRLALIPTGRELPRHEWPGPLETHSEASVQQMLSAAKQLRRRFKGFLVKSIPRRPQDEQEEDTGHRNQSLMDLVDTDTDSDTGSAADVASQGDTTADTEQGSVANLYARLAVDLSQQLSSVDAAKQSQSSSAGADSTALVPRVGGHRGGTNLLTPLPSQLAGLRGDVLRVGEERSDQVREWANEDFSPPPEVPVLEGGEPPADALVVRGGSEPSTPPSGDDGHDASPPHTSTALVPLAPPEQLAQWDSELAAYMLPPAAAKARTVVWRRLHGEYMDDLQQRLREGKVVPRKRRQRAGAGGPGADAEKLEGASAAEAVEAMLIARSTSKKVNYSALENLDALFAAAGAGSDDDAAADYHDALGLGEEEPAAVSPPRALGKKPGVGGAGRETSIPSPSHRRRPAVGEGGLRNTGGGLPMGQFGKRPRAPSVSHVVVSGDEGAAEDSDVGEASPGAIRQLKRSSAAAADVGQQRAGGGDVGSLSAAILGGGGFAEDSDDDDDDE